MAEIKWQALGLDTDPAMLDISTLTSEPSIIPKTSMSDMHLFLIARTSQHTGEQIKAWKSMLGSEDFVKSGWVLDLRLLEYKYRGKQRFLIIGKVRHSQRLNDAPLIPWFVAEENGNILGANCNCMAGLGSACSHIGAIILCTIKANHCRVENKDSCTSLPSVWMPPSRKKVQPTLVKDITFVHETVPGINEKKCNAQLTVSADSLQKFLSKINTCQVKPAILRVMEGFSQQFVTPDLPLTLDKQLYDPLCRNMSFIELVAECAEKFKTITISQECSDIIEQLTVGQALCKAWFRYRIGRVTASIWKLASKTKPQAYSKSLIKKICYPEAYRFSNEATRWGSDNEDKALKCFYVMQAENHVNFSISKAGLRISEKFPHVAASPDGVTSCDCCGKGLVEVKCPFKFRESLPDICNIPSEFCMENCDGKWSLKSEHAYFYQVQCQLHVWNLRYCDFVIWSLTGLITQRITKDSDFFQSTLPHVNAFYVNGVMPELVGKWHSRKPLESRSANSVATSNLNNLNGNVEIWCTCQQPERDTMIACDNDTCDIKWYHISCLSMENVPKGKWFCSNCKPLKKKKSRTDQ